MADEATRLALSEARGYRRSLAARRGMQGAMDEMTP